MDRSKLPANVCVADDVKLGENVRLAPFVNLYGCEIGDDSRIGTFVEVQKQASIGKRCKISSHTFICSGVVIEDGVFIGHGVVFINDRLPRAVNGDGSLQTESDWRLEETRVREGASIGSGAIIMCGVTIGERAMVGAGALVTHDVPPYAVVAGHPARVRRLMLAENGAVEKGEIRMQIKFVDLAALNDEIRERVDREFAEIHKNTAYIGGPHVEAFEKEFAEFLGVRHVIGVGSGTDALRLALMALDVGAGDEVITTPMTFIATAASIIQTGAKPVFVDVDPETCNLNPVAVRRYFETHKNGNGKPHKRVIMPVHLYGLPAAMAELNAIANDFGALVVEDACQAHGARIKTQDGWLRAGAMSAASAFSFYPGKNLGAWGEAGAVAVDDDELTARITSLRDHGRISHYAHQEIGYNARLDAIQSAVLRAKLEKLNQWNGRRRKLAKAYCERLAGCGVKLPVEPEGYESVYHLFVIRTEKRDAIRQALLEKNIGCGIHYPLPLHLQPACRYLGYKSGDFPDAERVADTALSLPMHPALTISDVDRVAEVVRETMKKESGLFAGGHSPNTAACEPPPTCGG